MHIAWRHHLCEAVTHVRAQFCAACTCHQRTDACAASAINAQQMCCAFDLSVSRDSVTLGSAPTYLPTSRPCDCHPAAPASLPRPAAVNLADAARAIGLVLPGQPAWGLYAL